MDELVEGANRRTLEKTSRMYNTPSPTSEQQMKDIVNEVTRHFSTPAKCCNVESPNNHEPV